MRLPNRLERISVVSAGDLVPVDNSAQARFVLDGTGRSWIRKLEEDTGYQCLLAEVIGTLLGQKLGALIPQGAIYVGPDGAGWLSRRVDVVGHWRPVYRDRVSNLPQLAAMLVTDALIANGDRHARNLLVEPDPDESSLRIHAIDAGNALVGSPDDFLALRADEIPSVHNHARGIPVEALRGLCPSVAARAESLDPSLVGEFVAEGCQVVREPQVEALTEALVRRCRQASALSARYLDALGGLQ